MYKDFEEFKKKIRPNYGPGNFTKNSKLPSFVVEKEEKDEQECDGNCYECFKYIRGNRIHEFVNASPVKRCFDLVS